MHSQCIREQIDTIVPRGRPLAVWSAACSSGEEVYSLAMLLADLRGYGNWHVLGTDISMRVLRAASTGLYPMDRTEGIPADYLRRFCLRGKGAQAGRLLVERRLRANVSFSHLNLNEDLPRIGPFRLVLLRNALIYFDRQTKAEIVRRVLATLEPGGLFMIGHSETLHGLADGLQMLRPSVYRKVAT